MVGSARSYTIASTERGAHFHRMISVYSRPWRKKAMNARFSNFFLGKLSFLLHQWTWLVFDCGCVSLFGWQGPSNGLKRSVFVAIRVEFFDQKTLLMTRKIVLCGIETTSETHC